MSKKTWILISCLVLSLTLGLGGSLAYLTDTDTKINTFTMGNVDIKVEEDFGEDGKAEIRPGMTVTKKAKITNIGNNDAWVWLTVAVPAEVGDYIQLNWLNDANYDLLAYQCLDENGQPELDDNGNERWVNYTHAGDEAGRNYWVYTMLYKNKLNTTDNTSTRDMLQSVKLSEYVGIVDGKYYGIDHGDLFPIDYDLDGMEIIVTGYAIQTDGFDTVYEAYDAYGMQWGDLRVESAPKTEGKEYTSSATINEYIVLPSGETDRNDDCVVATGEDTVVVVNGGMYDTGSNIEPCAVWAIGGATVEIYEGAFWCDGEDDVTEGNQIDLIYAGSASKGGGHIRIYGGEFGARNSQPNNYNTGAWLLNINDAHRAAGTGSIVVYGGDFYNWNPANNPSEGEGTDFVDDNSYVWKFNNTVTGEDWFVVLENDERYDERLNEYKEHRFNAADGWNAELVRDIR